MSNTFNSDNLETYEALFDDNFGASRVKFAKISFYNAKHYPYIEKALLYVELIQLILQIILQTHILDPAQDLSSKSLVNALYFIAKIFNPGYFLYGSKSIKLLWTFQIIIICYIVLYFITISYTLKRTRAERNPVGWGISLWQWIFKLQIRLTTSIIVSTCFNLILIGAQAPGILFKSLVIISWIILACNTVATLTIFIRCNHRLPTKSLFSTKNVTMELIIFTQKVLLMAFQVFLMSYPSLAFWIITAGHLIFSVVMTWCFFIILPYYNLKVLFMRGAMAIVALSLSSIYFLRGLLLIVSHKRVGEDSTLIVWMMLIPLILKGYQMSMVKTLRNLVIAPKPSSWSIEFLIHKVIITKQIMKTNKTSVNPGNQVKDWSDLLFSGIKIRFEEMLSVSDNIVLKESLKIKSKDLTNKALLLYLENLMMRFPNNDFLRLYMAYFYMKHLKQYGNSFQTIDKLQKSTSSLLFISIYLLKHELQSRMSSGSQAHNVQR